MQKRIDEIADKVKMYVGCRYMCEKRCYENSKIERQTNFGGNINLFDKTKQYCVHVC